jgi:hypothetical protein
VTGFPEFPNTSPSGKRVDSDDPIPRIIRKFSKNVTLGTSEGTRVVREIKDGWIEASFAELPLPGPINSGLSLLKNFTAFQIFTIRASLFRGTWSSAECSRASSLLRTFIRYSLIFLLSIVTCYTLVQLYRDFANLTLECHFQLFVCSYMLVRWLELKAQPDP